MNHIGFPGIVMMTAKESTEPSQMFPMTNITFFYKVWNFFKRAVFQFRNFKWLKRTINIRKEINIIYIT